MALRADGVLKLIDFGLVRIRDSAGITSEDDVLGTPYFMAPEYIRAPGIPDIRYDLYALGITLFYLVSGKFPFDADNAVGVLTWHVNEDVPDVRNFASPIAPTMNRWSCQADNASVWPSPAPSSTTPFC